MRLPPPFSVQQWLENAAQGYLLGTEYGHLPDQGEPPPLLENDALRDGAVATTVQLVAFERLSLAASVGLLSVAPDDPSATFLATQILDEARHVEVFRRRLLDLGVDRGELDDVVAARTDPRLVQLTGLVLEPVERRDFLTGMVGLNVFLEGLATHVLDLLHAANDGVNPKFAYTVGGVLADEGRHAAFGEHRVRELLAERPDRKPELARLQRELVAAVLATFANAFAALPRGAERMRLRQELRRRMGSAASRRASWHGRDLDALEPEEVERVLVETVLRDWRRRVERLGLAYQAPVGL
jgi:hypothetical protein